MPEQHRPAVEVTVDCGPKNVKGHANVIRHHIRLTRDPAVLGQDGGVPEIGQRPPNVTKVGPIECWAPEATMDRDDQRAFR
jgi:hypothetical protein